MSPFIPDLTGKAVLVTGAGIGIGRSIALAAHTAGATVGVHYAHSEDEARAVVAEIDGGRGKAILLQGDLTQKADAERVVKEFCAQTDQLDGLVNNAGGMVKRSMIGDLDMALLHQVTAVNVETALLTCQAALPYFRAAGGGSIVNITSIASFQAVSNGAHYAAAKAMLTSFTRSMAVEWIGDNIRVNAVAPGVILTRFHEIHSSPERLNQLLTATPMGRHGEADEVAGAVIYLLSDAASFVTGANMDVNGGRFIP